MSHMIKTSAFHVSHLPADARKSLSRCQLRSMITAANPADEGIRLESCRLAGHHQDCHLPTRKETKKMTLTMQQMTLPMTSTLTLTQTPFVDVWIRA